MKILSKKLHKIRINTVKPYLKGNVLDLGCGPANYLNIPKEGMNYYGVERKEHIEGLKKKYPQYKFFQKDLDEDKLDFNVKFDTVILTAVIEHIYNQKHLFKEIIKNLKPNGRIIITTPTTFGNDVMYRIGSRIGLVSRGGYNDHIIIYNKERFKLIAKDFNLEIEKYKKFELGFNQLVIFKKN